ncbi:RDD family protein [Jatrophihabitans endophyticus]|uniref:RDD family protein n=1 Tax=Jatrophihabitans endophyticus TaxID=1206085 RepID=A0A1M5KXJ7_9ACTN|nr:RDD family protein [Jatrophihabitans endophyticus]SHG57445.1 RDD family protein [Jatrophihabitans endophyticus]
MTAPQTYRGERIGLPRTGAGSLAPTGARLGAFLVDALASSLVAALFAGGGGDGFAGALPGSWSLVPLAVDYLVGVLVAGRTLGMYLLGLRLVRVDRTAPVDPVRVAVRTVLLFLLVPAVVFDRDGRGMHDRLTDTAVVRAR